MKTILLSLITLCLTFSFSELEAQTYTFTNCSAAGRIGPTQTQANSAYTATTLSGLVTVVDSGVQQWTPPIGGTYRITVSGASGATTWASAGGQGITISCEVALSSSTTYNVVVGQEGIWNNTSSNYHGGSGGGGSFVYTGLKGGTGLIVAAGGGGGGQSSITNADPNNADANYRTSGDTISIRSWIAPGGTNGSGGQFSTRGINASGPGAGWVSDYNPINAGGGPALGGTRWLGGIPNSTIATEGGFGGGGACGSNSQTIHGWAGGGGGYSGGGGGGNGGQSDGQMGGGGGSFLTGANQTNVGFNSGMGSVVFTLLCTPDSSTQSLNICYGDTVWVGSNAHGATGVYKDTIPGANCDSIVTTNLTVSTAINLTVTTVTWPLALTANEASATYQWLDCDNNMAAISGATAQTYNPTANGNYAVAVTVGSCTDTSACQNVNTVGMDVNELRNVKLLPNPTEGLLKLEYSSTVEISSITVTDMVGRKVIGVSNYRSGDGIDITNQQNGIYLVRVISSTGSKRVFTVVKN